MVSFSSKTSFGKGVIVVVVNSIKACNFVICVQILPRERKKHEYMDAVKNRYKHLPEVKRILRYYCYMFFIESCSGENRKKKKTKERASKSSIWTICTSVYK